MTQKLPNTSAQELRLSSSAKYRIRPTAEEAARHAGGELA
jgi:hypothetical protein